MLQSTSTPPGIIAKVKLSKTAGQFWRITKAFFRSERRGRAHTLFMLLLTLSIGYVGVIVLTSYAGRDFITAIEKKDSHAYWTAMWRYLGSFVVAILINVCYRWAEQSLAMLWRERMAQHLIKRYFNNRACYRLRGLESIDNPDQRISEDVRNFTLDSLGYALMVVDSVMTLIGFLGVLWSISGALAGVALTYAAFGTFMCFVIGRRLVGLHYARYQREADFRYGLVRVRDNAESIAFYRGGETRAPRPRSPALRRGCQHAHHHPLEPEPGLRWNGVNKTASPSAHASGGRNGTASR